VEIPDDQNIRSRLIEQISKIFSRWLGEVEDVVLLDWKDSKLTTRSSDIAGIQSYSLSSSQILCIYFTCQRASEKSVLSISKNADTVVYKVSLPTIDIRDYPEELLHLLCNLFIEISAMGLHCVVTGGGELEIEESLQSVSDVIRSASEQLSLVEYLCCDKIDAAQLTNFSLVQDSGNASLFRRISRA
jgi:hypothetical protein